MARPRIVLVTLLEPADEPPQIQPRILVCVAVAFVLLNVGVVIVALVAALAGGFR